MGERRIVFSHLKVSVLHLLSLSAPTEFKNCSQSSLSLKSSWEWGYLVKVWCQIVLYFLHLLICLLWFHCCIENNQEEAINDFLFSCAVMNYMRNILLSWVIGGHGEKHSLSHAFKYFLNGKKKIVFYWQVTCPSRFIILTTNQSWRTLFNLLLQPVVYMNNVWGFFSHIVILFLFSKKREHFTEKENCFYKKIFYLSPLYVILYQAVHHEQLKNLCISGRKLYCNDYVISH